MSKRVAAFRAGVPDVWPDGIRRPFDGELPARAEARTQELEALGFRRVAIEWVVDSVEVVLWREDGVIGEVTYDTALPTGWPELSAQFITPLLGGGQLCTATACLVPDLWEAEIGQVFPAATPNEVAAHHADATRYLLGLGFRVRIVPMADALKYSVWASRTGWTAAARAPRRAVASELRRIQAVRHSSVGPI